MTVSVAHNKEKPHCIRRRRSPFHFLITCFLLLVWTPATTSANDACSQLQVGDIQILEFNSQNPDEIYFLALAPIVPDVGSIFVTNYGWNGTNFVSSSRKEGRGTIAFQIPQVTVNVAAGGSGNRCDGICEGGEFFYKSTMIDLGPVDRRKSWTAVFDDTPTNTNNTESSTNNTKIFDLDETNGDIMLIYCLKENDEPNFLHAVTFLQDNPPPLPLQPLALPYFEKFKFNGYDNKFDYRVERQATRENLMNPTYWVGSNDSRETTENNETLFNSLWILLGIIPLVIGICTWFAKCQKKQDEKNKIAVTEESTTV